MSYIYRGIKVHTINDMHLTLSSLTFFFYQLGAHTHNCSIIVPIVVVVVLIIKQRIVTCSIYVLYATFVCACVCLYIER